MAEENPRSPYDPDPPDEADLWFLPGPPEDAAWDMPGPRAARPPALPDAAQWAAAEGAQARALAEAAAGLARLDERVAGAPWAVRRLALEEAAGLSWLAGAGVAADRLALYDVLRLTRMADAHRDFAAAHWAFRRLRGGPGPLAGELAAFLGRHGVQHGGAGEDGLGDLSLRPTGEVFADLAQAWRAAVPDELHPLTRGAAAWLSWRALALSGPEPGVEGLVAAARVAAGGLHALPFVPVAVAGRGLVRQGGASGAVLAAWLRAVETGAAQARLTLDRLAAWKARAGREVAAAGLKGRTPARLIAALLATPALSAPMAARLTGASQAAALRNLAWFEARGLAREITGQGRFRVWAAAG